MSINSLVNLRQIVPWPRKNCNRTDFCDKVHVILKAFLTTYQKGRKKWIGEILLICINTKNAIFPVHLYGNIEMGTENLEIAIFHL